jgi:pimeloyl-ACP methyl ester carboxylesterase
MTQTRLSPRTHTAVEYVRHAEKLSLEPDLEGAEAQNGGTAVSAKFITPLDPVVETADGNRLPAVPIYEAHKLNLLKNGVEDRSAKREGKSNATLHQENTGTNASPSPAEANEKTTDRQLELAIPPWRTHPLFPQLPLYGPPSLLRNIQCAVFKVTSFFLSTAFLAVIVLGSVFTSIPKAFQHLWLWITFRDPDARRPFYAEEYRRQKERRLQEREWKSQPLDRRKSVSSSEVKEQDSVPSKRPFAPSEGGADKLVCDISYYARRVGLDAEEFRVQTEDGFLISLFHIFDPSEYRPASARERRHSKPEIFTDVSDRHHDTIRKQYQDGQRRYPVLLVHGLLQSAGAYCTNDDDSLAFLLCKSGYDVWLGNNRCGFTPEHSLLQPNDPRLWAWNIRQMGVLDLPALISRVLEETGFEKLGLVCHSQGTTETFVALAKEQRPDLGNKISVFCALAPAVYAGPLIEKMYFKFMRIVSPGMFRIFFGIHSFIPLMMTMHRVLPGRVYGFMGYRVFSFLFSWSDDRWDRGLRDRFFQFSPVYVSAESMRWWLGRECFAKHKTILATREEADMEEAEDGEDSESDDKARGSTAWYDEQVPLMALWVAGSDELVDGRRLLRRFETGREPHVRIVHSKVIDEYEHLDVLWAMDAVEKVGKEVRQVLFDTMPPDARAVCRSIEGVGGDRAGEGGAHDGLNT